MIKLDFSNTEPKNNNCEHKVIELLDNNYDKLYKIKSITFMCVECGINWEKEKIVK